MAKSLMVVLVLAIVMNSFNALPVQESRSFLQPLFLPEYHHHHHHHDHHDHHGYYGHHGYHGHHGYYGHGYGHHYHPHGGYYRHGEY
ncbi:unnamed protein product [Phyllotreta striolata]|uniref:Uncharacterized protein n=1 Tax=Phyllotreta striolata TaxID=444603 RepID=A0A9N9TGF5_PHYSR|nr:unnamed protein product [Phyllotreta striolata]